MVGKDSYFYKLAKKTFPFLSDKRIDEVYNLTIKYNGSVESKDEQTLLKLIRDWAETLDEEDQIREEYGEIDRNF